MARKQPRPNNVVRFRRSRPAKRRRARSNAHLARRLQSLVTLAAFALLSFVAQGFVKTAIPREEFDGVVRRVSDGDTLLLAGMTTPIRLWGVDAPELGELSGFRSADYLESLVSGRRLACKEMDIDRYQRVVARCFIVDTGEEVNALMIEEGAAAEYVHYTGGYYALRRLANSG
jgi:endonuclease YncB( thermonuclease family)